MATKNRKQQSKKSAGEAVARARINPAVQAAVGLGGVTFNADGRAVVTALLDVPAPTMRENEKYPWTPWNVDYLKKQFAKDLRRVAQTVANHQYVAGLLESRAAERAATRAQKPAVEQAQPAGERPSVAQ
jgi:hypothetical protein